MRNTTNIRVRAGAAKDGIPIEKPVPEPSATRRARRSDMPKALRRTLRKKLLSHIASCTECTENAARYALLYENLMFADRTSLQGQNRSDQIAKR